MTLKAPFHEQCVFAPGHRHLIDWPVTGRATDSASNVNAVIEIDEIWQIVDPSPFQRAVFAKAGAHGFECGTVRPNLRMTIHARLRRRNSSKTALFDRRVAVTAINADPRYMMFVAEWDRLHTHNARFREIRRAHQRADDSYESCNDEHRAEDADLRQSVRTPMEDLSHTGTFAAVCRARWIPGVIWGQTPNY